MSLHRVLSAHEKASYQEAARILRQGGLVAFPTETVYGLGADALNVQAVCRIFEAKQRPAFDPLIVHEYDPDRAFELCREVPPEARLLAARFWPGPLTMVLPKKEIVPDLVTSGLETVAVRVPRHEVARELLKAFGGPIAAPSANVFGYTSPTTAAHVEEDLGEKVDLILDGGSCPVGVESTVIAFEGSRVRILRPGGVTAEELADLVRVEAYTAKGRVESPGQMTSHYAPWTPLHLLPGAFGDFLEPWDAAKKVFFSRKGRAVRAGLLVFREGPSYSDLETILALSRDGALEEAASNLFEAVRKLDKMHLDVILAEPPPDRGIGRAIADRLFKAASGRKASKDMFNDL